MRGSVRSSRPNVTSLYSVGTALSVAAEKSQICLRVRSGDPLDNDVDRAVACWNSADDFLVRLQRIRPRTFGRVAHLRQPRWQPRVEHDEQLVRQRRRGLAGPRREVLRRDLVLVLCLRRRESPAQSPGEYRGRAHPGAEPRAAGLLERAGAAGGVWARGT